MLSLSRLRRTSWLPGKVCYHVCDTSWGSCSVVVEDIPSRTSLNLFQGFDTGLLGRVPDGGCVLQYRVYHLFYVKFFTSSAQSLRFLRRNPNVLFPLLTAICMCLSHDKSSVSFTPKVFAGIHHFKGMVMKLIVCLADVFFLFEILSTRHFVGLKLICQAFSQSSNGDRSLCSSSLSLSFSITLKSRLSSANSFVSEDNIDSGRSLMKQRNRSSPRSIPCGTPGVTFAVFDFTTSRMTC